MRRAVCVQRKLSRSHHHHPYSKSNSRNVNAYQLTSGHKCVSAGITGAAMIMCNKGGWKGGDDGDDEACEKYRESRITNQIMCLPFHFHFVRPIHSLYLTFLAAVGIQRAIGVSADNFTPFSGNDPPVHQHNVSRRSGKQQYQRPRGRFQMNEGAVWKGRKGERMGCQTPVQAQEKITYGKDNL